MKRRAKNLLFSTRDKRNNDLAVHPSIFLLRIDLGGQQYARRLYFDAVNYDSSIVL